MFETVMEWVNLAAVFNGAFLAIAIPFIPTPNRLGKWWLASIFIVLTIMLLESYLGLFKGRTIFGLGLLGEFFLGPLIYLFTHSLVERNTRLDRHMFLYFLPLGVASLLLVLINAGLFGLALSDFSNQHYPGTALWVTAKLICMAAFMIPAYRQLSRHLEVVPSAHRKFARPVRWFFWVTGALLLGIYSNYYLYYFGLPGIPDSDRFSLLYLSASLLFLGLTVVTQRQILNGFSISGASADPALVNRVRRLVQEEDISRDPDLTLSSLAAQLGVSTKELSRAFYQAFHQRFQDEINARRIQMFKDLASGANQHLNILDLAYESGFNSKATFYRAFRVLEGMSPKVYLSKSQNRI